jgi:hypothetical protein
LNRVFVARARYRRNLRAAVAASAAPYGYTLAIWTSGATVTHARGIPTTLEAVLFMAGAVAAFALVGSLAYGELELWTTPEERRVRLWGTFHVPSVGLAIAAAALAGDVLRNATAWPVAGFLATAIYLAVLAAQLAFAEAHAN